MSDGTERDYASEMRAVIDAETSGGPYVSAVVAEHIADKLRATDPHLLDGWLRQNAAFLIRHMINLRDCSVRSRARIVAKRSVFGAAAKDFEETGDVTALAGWLGVVHVIEDGSRKRLSDMTAADLSFVASDYEERAKENAMHAAFLRAIAKKVGRRTVADVFTDQKLNDMWASLSRRQAA